MANGGGGKRRVREGQVTQGPWNQMIAKFLARMAFAGGIRMLCRHRISYDTGYSEKRRLRFHISFSYNLGRVALQLSCFSRGPQV